MVQPQDAPIQRRRTGCFTCRKRKKRCDETKPQCKACIRTGYVCEGYPSKVPFGHRCVSRPPAEGSINPRRSDHVSQESQRRVDIQQPTSTDTHGLVRGQESFQSDVPIHASEIPFAEMSPNVLDSLVMVAEGLDDIAFHPAQVESTDLFPPGGPTRAQRTRRTSIVQTEMPFLIDGLDSPIRRKLFMHFTRITSFVLTTSGAESNPFLVNIVPRSLHEPMIREALLCLAASHLSKLQSWQEISVEAEKKKCLEASEKEQVTRLALITTNSSPDIDADRETVTIAAILLFLYEISEGAGDACWRIRFDTLRQLIHSCPPNANPLTTDQWLSEFFVYHLVLASVTSPSGVSILDSEQDLLSSLSLSARPNTTQLIGAYDGLLQLVAKFSAFQYRVNQSRQIDGLLICEALELCSQLEQWQPNVPFTEDGTPEDLACSAYISSLFIWLYAMIYPHKMPNAEVQKMVRQGLNDLCQIDDSRISPVLLFPVFVIGFACVEDETRQQVSALFEKLIGFSGFGNVRLARDVAHQWWSNYDSGDYEGWNWTQQMDMYRISIPLT